MQIIIFNNIYISVSTQKFFRKQKKNFKKPSGLTDEDVKGALIRNKKPDFGGEPVSGSPFFAVAFISPFNSDSDDSFVSEFYLSVAYLARVLRVLQLPQYWVKLLLSLPFSTRNFGTIYYCQHPQFKSPKYAPAYSYTVRAPL